MFTNDSSLQPLTVRYMVQASHRDIAEQVDSGTLMKLLGLTFAVHMAIKFLRTRCAYISMTPNF
jgi:hypothetical protein